MPSSALKINQPAFISLAAWTSLPWLFAFVYSFHPFEHADPFWLPALPLVLFSFIPMHILARDVQGFPIQWVAVSSIFNLIAGLLLIGVVTAIRGRSQAQDARKK